MLLTLCSASPTPARGSVAARRVSWLPFRGADSTRAVACALLIVLIVSLPFPASAYVAGEAIGASLPPSSGLAYDDAHVASSVEPSTGVFGTSLAIELPRARGLAQPGLGL